MAARYKNFDEIPTRFEIDRLMTQAHRAQDVFNDGGADTLTEDDLHALDMILPDVGRAARREQRRLANVAATPAAPPARQSSSVPQIRTGESFDEFVDRCGDQPAPMSLIEVLVRVIADGNKDDRERFATLERRLEELESRGAIDGRTELRLRELEARPQLRYRGVWTSGTVYTVGDLCTHRGSIWHCQGDTSRPPGVDFDSWTLAVKHGAPGKDARP